MELSDNSPRAARVPRCGRRVALHLHPATVLRASAKARFNYQHSAKLYECFCFRVELHLYYISTLYRQQEQSKGKYVYHFKVANTTRRVVIIY